MNINEFYEGVRHTDNCLVCPPAAQTPPKPSLIVTAMLLASGGLAGLLLGLMWASEHLLPISHNIRIVK